MKILSLNAWGGAIFDALRAWLPTCGADVVCLQEVTRTEGLSGWTEFTDGHRRLPQRADLFRDMVDVLPDHVGRFVLSDSGPVTGSDGRRRQQDFGIATFVHRGIAVPDGATTFVHGALVRHAEWPSEGRPRVAEALRLVPSGAAAVTVVQVHGLHDPAGKSDTPARLAQAERISELVTRVRAPGDLAVVCGDLNVLPDSRTFDVLAQVGMTDLVRYADTRTSQYSKPVRHASYLLVSDPARVRRFEIVEAPEVSDHRALLVDLY
ncbi:MAG TPA: endonuclease/exonuclease/phosphatase family protein [Egicoccus sp.]|nr:endonuclease/exonuclease/phosphatase family protein [Egicoccus sp.]HSK23669.1 endonuclease/exonuclease/phosphatase family protein [Egicoccus sp.]